MENYTNVFEAMLDTAQREGNREAIIIPALNHKAITFNQLKDDILFFQHKLLNLNLKKGSTVLCFVPIEQNFHALIFALFSLELVPILMDPGMGKKNILKSIKSVKPDAFLTIKKGILFYLLYKKYFPKNIVNICLSSFKILGFAPLLNLKTGQSQNPNNQSSCEKVKTDINSLAAILFTSGGTGTPKGVLYTHKIFLEQIRLLKNQFNLDSSKIDFPGFPLFGLFTLSMGMKIVIPRINFASPSKSNPKLIVEDILKYECTFLAGSPSIWELVANYCHEKNIRLNSVTQLITFGAPLSLKIIQKLSTILLKAEIYPPYGATESLPISVLPARLINAKYKEKIENGNGMPVGDLWEGVDVKIIKNTKEVILNLENDLIINESKNRGEIIVSSPTTTLGYFKNENATKNSKLYYNGKIYHRMGDIGYFDEDKVLWYCGRKSHVINIMDNEVNPLFPIEIELMINSMPEVRRSAVVVAKNNKKQNNKDEICLVIQRVDQIKYLSRNSKENFIKGLREIGKRHPLFKYIQRIYIYNHFPLDGRHNIKIDRIKLGEKIISKGVKIL